MRALVISGGGSKGAFAGGVAQYLLEIEKKKYDIFIGTSTGSLLVSHLAMHKINEIKAIYTSVNQNSIFSNCPFTVRTINEVDFIKINHFHVLKSFLKGSKTFGDSENLKKLIKKNITETYFKTLKNSGVDLVITVTNLTKNEAEYKSIKDCSYDEYCEWIWVSCNYVPFMSIVSKNGFEYGDGGFAALVPIKEAIERGATEIDVIVLDREGEDTPIILGKNAFSLLVNLFNSLMDHVKKADIEIGKLAAINKNVQLNWYYTPVVLTTNSLIFNRKKMNTWWQDGYQHARNIHFNKKLKNKKL